MFDNFSKSELETCAAFFDIVEKNIDKVHVVRVKEKSTGKQRIALCLAREQGDEYLVFPFAILFNEDDKPFDEYAFEDDEEMEVSYGDIESWKWYNPTTWPLFQSQRKK